ncbi:hypothetical protein BCR44DRAFT_1452915 [Catenaria anguillulae PL171]|uniref:Uncharacterized protein n=1 Tax=Catenaria anguillulae PL171 TaxID=765915 RepID=A0A1Y2H437_9FUNG|nr:hypothetical protein BCR44DRAFT_1452915 [Catenaria anguillulae PL171]
MLTRKRMNEVTKRRNEKPCSSYAQPGGPATNEGQNGWRGAGDPKPPVHKGAHGNGRGMNWA